MRASTRPWPACATSWATSSAWRDWPWAHSRPGSTSARSSSGPAPRSAEPGRRPARACCGVAEPGSEPFDDGDVGLASALAHRLQAPAPAGALELIEQRGHEPGAGGAQRVPEGDGAAVDVDLGRVGAGLAPPGDHDRGERLVDLDEVDVVEAHA